jgi:site-specific recombinase XerD
MTNNLPAVTTGAAAPAIVSAVESVKGYIGASMAANTRRAYEGQWETFTRWCADAGLPSLPADPGTISAYLAYLADNGKKPATIDSARAAIRKYHEGAGVPDPTSSPLVKQTLKGIRREKGTAPAQKAPALTADMRRLVASIPNIKTAKGQDRHPLCTLRDKALLLLGFATGSRRSELVSLTVEDLQETAKGLLVTIRRSKTDQEGKGMVKGVVRGEHADTCPVSALLEWIQAAGITSGPVFRNITKGGKLGEQLTPQTVALIMKAAAVAAKLDPAKYSGHSLRAGMVTQAAMNGMTVTDIMRHTGHRSPETVTRYIRIANVFENNASAALGL